MVVMSFTRETATDSRLQRPRSPALDLSKISRRTFLVLAAYTNAAASASHTSLRIDLKNESSSADVIVSVPDDDGKDEDEEIEAEEGSYAGIGTPVEFAAIADDDVVAEMKKLAE